MSSEHLDRYGRRRSVCHRLPPTMKILLALGIVAVGVSLPVELWPAQGALASLVFLGHSLAHIPLAYLMRRLVLFLPVMFLLAISVPAAEGFGRGWEIMAAIMIRSTLAFITALWLVNVMPFDQLLVTLRRLWVPATFVAMLAFMYRYFYVLWDELDKMRVARRARSFGEGRLWFRWKTSAQMIGMLLLRALDRAERVHGAMCARGWDGRVRSLDD